MSYKIDLSHQPGVPLTQQLVDRFARAIDDGLLAPGEKLPTTRELARDAAVNHLTAARVYRRLAELGYVTAAVGRGTFVRALPPVTQGPAGGDWQIAALPPRPASWRELAPAHPAGRDAPGGAGRRRDARGRAPRPGGVPDGRAARNRRRRLRGRGRRGARLRRRGGPAGAPPRARGARRAPGLRRLRRRDRRDVRRAPGRRPRRAHRARARRHLLRRVALVRRLPRLARGDGRARARRAGRRGRARRRRARAP